MASKVKNKFTRLNNNLSVSYKKAFSNIDNEVSQWADEAVKLQQLQSEMLELYNEVDELEDENSSTELMSATHFKLMDDVETLLRKYVKEEKKQRRKNMVSTIEQYCSVIMADDFDPSLGQSMTGSLEDAWMKFVTLHNTMDENASNSEVDISEGNKILSDLLKQKNLALGKILKTKHTCTNMEVKSLNPQTNLPTISLPKFNGNITQWFSFRDKFQSLIHNNGALQDIQKFHYLDSCLTLEAREEISHLQLTEQNYNIAWDHLNHIYNNNRNFVQTNIKQMFDVQYDTKNSVSSLKKILSVCKTNLVALKTLDPDISVADQIIIYIIESKMDRYLYQEWAKKGNKKELKTLDQLFEFIDEMVCILTATEKYKGGQVNDSDENMSKSWNTKAQFVPVNTCAICGTGHKTENCISYKKALVKERMEMIKKHKLCFNCLSNKHSVSRCLEKQRCGTCNRKHHISIHLDQRSMQAYKVVEDIDGSPLDYEIPMSSVEDSLVKGSVTEASSCASTVSNSNSSMVLLPTALVYVKSGDGQTVPVRALLDAGSQVNLISNSCMEKLKLKATKVDIKLCGIGKASVDATKVVDIQVQTKSGNFSRKIRAIALPQITSTLPAQKISIDKHKYLLQYELADPEFFIPNMVDMILGAEIFYDILTTGRVANFPGRPAMQNTVFGWVVAGRLPTYSNEKSIFSCNHVTSPDPLTKFWEIEELPPLKNNYSKEEKECEEYFEETTYRSEDGKFVVRIPFKENLKDIGHSKMQALQRYKSLEKRLDKDEKLKANYNSFLKEYLELGHMERVKNDTIEEKIGNTEFYFSHFPVLRSESLTTKLRVVFDGSMKTSSGISLNETMKVGPILQDDLFSILLRLRVHKIVLISDLEKMYRQIWIHSDDRKYQKILWRQEEHEEIKTFQLKTVTYGTSSAPYLAVKCLKTLANDEEKGFPNASKIAKRDFYVDDLITGVESEDEGIALYKELTAMFEKAGFNLRKWISNSESVLNAIPGENRADQLESVFQNTMKTLGLKYNPSTDMFLFSLPPGNVQFTKRNILSEIGKLFDPLGLISPVIVTAKMFLQELWLLNFSWDEKLDEKTVLKWRQIVSGMEHINQIQIDRHAFVSLSSDIEFHGFCDASEKAYAACLYVKCKQNGKSTVKLLCAKTRVAPVKQISLARLELCAALLLTNLIKKVREGLNEHGDGRQWFAWTDSQIVLAWISKLPCNWKTFVANRVSAIQEVLSPGQWKYVKSEDNPADLASRGCSGLELSNAKTWWAGPIWLVSDSYNQDNTQVFELNNVPEAKKVKSTCLLVSPELDSFWKYSNYSKLMRITSLCLRFIFNLRNKKEDRITGLIKQEELLSAECSIIKVVQKEKFSEEIDRLSKNKPVNQNSKLKSLNPIIDKFGVLRVGGRLENADIEFNRKHQIILPHEHKFTKLLIIHEHEKNAHAGQQVMTNHLRQKFWILNSRTLIRQLLHKCLRCFRAKMPPPSNQLMGNLPKERVNATSRPFVISGVDYCGPFQIKRLGGRTNTLWKAYVVLFICFTTKAVHIEVASDLSTKTFLAALKRFSARRGLPAEIFSDNGTNFVGANNELKGLESSTAMMGIKWHFIPGNSPHFGGLWESNVKSYKRHLKASIGNQILTYEELLTISTIVESYLNSRPLVPMFPNDPEDFDVLTPGHFLVGGPLLTVPEDDVIDVTSNRLARWKLIQKIHQSFWKRWSTEYLHHLQQRNKWTVERNNIKLNDLVLIREDNLHPLQWAMGRVVKVFPGFDGKVRAVEVKTKNGILKRSITRLAPLPIND